MNGSVTIGIFSGGEKRKLVLSEGQTLFDVLSEAGYLDRAACGGRGKCGKCAVRAISPCAVSDDDRRHFSDKQLADGYRLACTVRPTEDMEIELGRADGGFYVPVNEGGAADDNKSDLGIAIDIGTTTVAVSLTDANGGIIKTFTSINPQRVFGGDVISRITASISGNGGKLKELICGCLCGGIRDVTTAVEDKSRIKRTVIACNTTMSHLLLGLPCDTLGVSPFTPVDISLMHKDFAGVFGERILDCEVTLLPGISTFVGSDIVSGMYYTDMDRSDKPVLFIDLGTNGELAIGDKERILATSTAAGPAFEGGNISCGTGSVEGAICGVGIDGDRPVIRTIGGAKPVGICGTGAVETVAALAENELIDETGLLCDDFFEEGYKLADGIYFTQKDVREMQLAKSAVRAGVETLLKRFGAEYKDIAAVYLAGGFGYRIDCAKAARIGMLPEELSDRITAVGNSSLYGAVRYIADRDEARIRRIVGMSDEIALSEDKYFNEQYIENMYF